MVHIHKELAVSEDFAWGWGVVSQVRDLITGGTGPVDYHKVNASVIPASDDAGAQTSDVQTELDLRLTIVNANKKFALLGGSQTQVFSVAPTTQPHHAVPQSQVTSQIAAAVSGIANNYAKRNNVLGLDQTAPFTPTKDYHPATKLYVDNKIVAIGAGDMAKATYDKNDNGVVDNSEALGGIAAKDAFMYRGTGAALDANSLVEQGNWSGTAITNAPDDTATLIANFVGAPAGMALQTAFSQGTGRLSDRVFDGSTWGAWNVALDHNDIINNFKGSTSPYAVASANAVKKLHGMIQGIEGVPVGSIVAFGGNISTIPADWKLCDGKGITPDLNNMFIKGVTDPNHVNATGGTKAATMPSHTHAANHGHTGTAASAGSHFHSARHNHTGSIWKLHVSGHTHFVSTEKHPIPGNQATPDVVIGSLREGTGAKWDVLQPVPPADPKAHNVGTTRAGQQDLSGPVVIDPVTFNTGSSGVHTHTISIPSVAINTGSAVAVGDNEPPFYTLMYIMKIA